MKKIFIIISAVLLFTASSCVTTLQPLVTHTTAIADTRLEGSWQHEGQQYQVQKFLNSDLYKKVKDETEKKAKANELSEKDKRDLALYSKSYIVKYTEDGIEYQLFGSMIKLNGRLFINFTPADMNGV